MQSTKMILKFRETHIGNMERGRKGEKPGGAQGSRGVAVGGRGKGERAAAGAESAEEKAPNEKEASLIVSRLLHCCTHYYSVYMQYTLHN